MENYVLITAHGKEYKLRIFLREVAELKKKLDGRSYLEASFDCMEDPATAVPFVWAAGQKNTGHPALTMDDAFDICDELITSGYGPEQMTELVIDICVVSGFFTEAAGETQKNLTRTALKSLAEGPKALTENMEALKIQPLPMMNEKTSKRSTSKG